MKMIEIAYASEIKEIEKLEARLERQTAKLEKAKAQAEKLQAVWTHEEHSDWLQTVPTENGYIINKEDVKRNGAWFDLIGAERDLEDTKWRIEKAQARLEKKAQAVEEYRQQIENIEDLKKREELMKAEFEAEQKEWAKDGITLESRYMGTTPQGKRFWIYRNSGYTERSWHCYTLTIDGQTIFTSGEFWRAYGIVKNN